MKKLFFTFFFFFIFQNFFLSQVILFSESFETDGEGVRYNSNTYSYCTGSPGNNPDYFLRTNTNPVIPTGCTIGFGDPLTNLQGSFFWAGEDIKSNVAPICSLPAGSIVTQTINIAGYTSLTFSLHLATANNNGIRWETSDSLNLQASINGGPFFTFGRFMGKAVAGGNLGIDSNLDGAITAADPVTNCDVTNFTQYGFSIPGTGSNLRIKLDFDQCGGTEELAVDLLMVGGIAAPCTNPTLPSILASPSASCPGTLRTLSVTSGNLNNATAWKWYTGSCGGTLVGTGNSITVNPFVTTTYYVRGEGGCVIPGSCSNITVIVNPNPTVTVNATSSVICSGSPSTLTANGAVFYNWSVGPLTQSIVVNPTVTTTYSVSGADFNGCSNIAGITITVNTLPNVTANASTLSVCNGNTVTLTGGGANTYTWTGGVTNAVPFSPGVTATYTVTGTNTSTSCKNSAVKTITVNSVPFVSVNSGSICAGNSFTLNPTGASTYNYLNGGPVVTPTTTTSYSVTGTSTAGCVSSNTAVSNVVVNPVPVISVNSGSICSGSSFTLNPTGANTYNYLNGGPVVTPTTTTSYSVTGTSTAGCVSSNTAVSNVIVNVVPFISVNSGSICSGDSFTLNPSGASTYNYLNGGPVVTPGTTSNYSVIGTSIAGCVSSNTAVANVLVNTTPTISISNGAICPGNSFTLNPTGASTYNYLNGGPVVTPGATTSYSVTGTSVAGCAASNTVVAVITVTNTLNVTITGVSTICNGQTANLTANGAATYTWDTGATTSTIAPTPSVNTTYSVTGVSGSCTNSAVFNLTVNPLPTINVISSSSLICSGQTITLTVNGANTYTWNTTANTISIVDSPSITTTYTVDGTDVNGCSNSATITQSVSLCTGIADSKLSEALINVYPNPNNGEFTIVAPEEGEYELINSVGQLVSRIKINKGSQKIYIGVLVDGMYYILGKTSRVKIVITN